MLEGLKQIKIEAGDRINRFLNDSLGLPLPREEVLSNFPHKNSCGETIPLKELGEITEEYVPRFHPYDIGLYVKVAKKYLVCDECGIRKQFSE